MGEQGTFPRRRRAAMAVAALSLATVALAVTSCSGDGEVRAAGGGSGSTTAAPAAPAGTDTAGAVGVTLDPDPTARTLRVVVDDPAAPTGAASRQCVAVELLPADGGPAVAEGALCNRDTEGTPAPGSATDGQVTLALRATDGVAIGSACTEEASTPAGDEPADGDTTGTAPARAAFLATVPDGLAAGRYRVVVAATSGVGPGCPVPGRPAGTATERAGGTEGTITLR